MCGRDCLGWLLLSFSALAGTLAMSVLNAQGVVDGDTSRWVLPAATAVWLSTAPPEPRAVGGEGGIAA